MCQQWGGHCKGRSFEKEDNQRYDSLKQHVGDQSETNVVDNPIGEPLLISGATTIQHQSPEIWQEERDREQEREKEKRAQPMIENHRGYHLE